VRRSRVATARTSSSQVDHESSFGTVLDFLRLLWAVEHGLTSISKHMNRRMGVTGQQRLVVKLVGQRPGISAGSLAEILHLHPSTLTGILRRLVDRGALERVQDPADTRRALFRLTAKGRELDAIRSGTVEARVRAALATMAEQDIAVASSVLGRLARALAPKS
jgi:MarR family transcriptional regulator, organic hydroperoxide resistance regulator